MTATVERPRRSAAPSVVQEIAARRRADIDRELAASGPVDASALDAAPPVRGILERFLDPGLHLIAEIKRASPSAGRIAADGEDIVARARAYEAGGAAAISVLCEPHWFGGSVDDLRAVRAAVVDPGPGQGVRRRRAPARAAAARRRGRGAAARRAAPGQGPPARARRAGAVARARAARRGPRRARAAPRGRHRCPPDRHQQPRPADARRRPGPRRPPARARARRPAGHRRVRGPVEPRPIARWRALGFDGALVGEALVRSGDPAATRPLLRGGRGRPDRSGQRRAPAAREDLRRSATRAVPSPRSRPGPTRSGSTSSRGRLGRCRSTRPRTWPGRSAPRRAAGGPADDRGDHRGRRRPRTWPPSSRPSIPTSSS